MGAGRHHRVRRLWIGPHANFSCRRRPASSHDSLDPDRSEVGHTRPDILPGGKAVLFEGQYYTTPLPQPVFAKYDVTPDGQRFLMVKANVQQAAATQSNVVLNWFEELKRPPFRRK